MLDRVDSLHGAIQNPTFAPEDVSKQLNTINRQLTEILLAGERQCARKLPYRQEWEPTSQLIARTYSYWRQKKLMVQKKLIHSHHLDQLQKNIQISDYDHQSLDIYHITEQQFFFCKMESAKEKCFQLHMKFLEERAALSAEKMRTIDEKALKAIKKADESKHIF